MKNYNEMARDVLRRVGEYEAARKQKRARLAKAVTALCCCALVALVGMGTHRAGLLAPDVPATVEDALYPGIPDLIDNRDAATVPTSPATESTANADTIVINPLENAPDSQQMYIALMLDDYVEMDREELTAYYGVNIFPTAPGDLIPREDSHGIYRRDGGTGEVYHDGVVLTYSNDDMTRTVSIGADKGTLPYNFLAFAGTEDKSVIGGTEVVIGQWDEACYYAEFVLQDVGFRIVAEGLAEEELIAVIASIIE